MDGYRPKITEEDCCAICYLNIILENFSLLVTAGHFELACPLQKQA